MSDPRSPLGLLAVDPDSEFGQAVADAFPQAEVRHAKTLLAANDAMGDLVQAVVLGPEIDFDESLNFIETGRRDGHSFGVVMVVRRPTTKMMQAAMRADVTDVLAAVHEPEELVEAVSRAVQGHGMKVAAAVAADAAAEADGRVVTVFSAKGGCGKSTVAANLAVLLAQREQRVCILDLDLQFGDAAIMFQLQPTLTLADAVQSFDELDAEAIKDFVSMHESGVAVLPSPLLPAQADDIGPEDVESILRLLRQAYDYVIVDTPAMFTDQVLVAIDAADRLVMLSSFDVPSIKNLRLGLTTLRQLGIDARQTDVVMVRADAKVGLRLKEVERTIGATIDIAIPSDREVTISLNHGIPLVLEHPKSQVVQAITRLADRIQGLEAATVADPDGARATRWARRRAGLTAS